MSGQWSPSMTDRRGFKTLSCGKREVSGTACQLQELRHRASWMRPAKSLPRVCFGLKARSAASARSVEMLQHGDAVEVQ